MNQKIYEADGKPIFPGVEEMGRYTGGYCGAYLLELEPGNWKQADESAAWPYSYDAPLPEAREELMPAGALRKDSYEAALTAGLAEFCETGAGAIRFYARHKPEEAIRVRVMLFGLKEET